MNESRLTLRPSAKEATTVPLTLARRPRVLEVVALLLVPLVAAIATRTEPMSVGLQTRWTMIDPSLYTAYIQHPADLMTRFGGADYYWVRLGFLLPAQASHAVFGAIGGFVALRYLLVLVAIVPGFLLFSRISSRPIAWCFVVATVSSPVILMAWNSDYPDSAAVSYLLGAGALVLLPCRSPRSYLTSRLIGGVLLGLAVNSHAASLPLVLAIIAGVGVTAAREHRIRILLPLIAGVVASSALLAGAAHALWGYGDIIGPTVEQFLRLRRPDQIAIWHSSTWGWFDRDTYLLVPAVCLGALIAALVGRRERPTRTSAAVIVAAGAGYLAAVLIQATGGFALEYYFYSSLLWWSVPFLLALVLDVISRGHPRASMIVWSTVGGMSSIAVVAAWEDLPVWRFPATSVGLLLGLLIIVVVTVVAPRARAGYLVVLGSLALVIGTWLLTVGQPVRAYAQGQVSYPLVDYSAVSRGDSALARDVYRAVSTVPSIVPLASRPGERVISWVPPTPRGSAGPPYDPVRQSAAQYLGSRLSSQMPALSPADMSQLDSAPAGSIILMISSTGSEFSAAEEALRRWEPRTVRTETVRSGPVTMRVLVLRLG